MTTPDTNPYGVKRGQIWADNDTRSAGRQIRVLRVAENVPLPYASVERVGLGTRSTIRLTRFRPNSTGYRLVRDVEEA